jgi:ABC-2 type transport system permease protein/sodium transport system permease protein
VAAVLFGLCLWPFGKLLDDALRHLHLTSLSEAMLARAGEALSRLRELPAVVVVLGAGVLPAVLEELFFRGYLFSALRAASSPRTAVVASAVLFGLFHLVGEVIVVERGVASTLLGLLLGWLCWKTGSVVPGMILHALHNSCLLLLAYYQPELLAAGWLETSQAGVPVPWLLAGGAGCVLAAGWVLLAYRGRAEPPPAADLAPADAGG